jgi:hypothetical protein
MPTYLIRLAQAHESFRKVELQALADLAGVELEFIKYEEDVRHPSRKLLLPFLLAYRHHYSCFYTMLALFYFSDNYILTFTVTILPRELGIRLCSKGYCRPQHISTRHLRAMGSRLNIQRITRISPQHLWLEMVRV